MFQPPVPVAEKAALFPAAGHFTFISASGAQKTLSGRRVTTTSALRPTNTTPTNSNPTHPNIRPTPCHPPNSPCTWMISETPSSNDHRFIPMTCTSSKVPLKIPSNLNHQPPTTHTDPPTTCHHHHQQTSPNTSPFCNALELMVLTDFK